MHPLKSSLGTKPKMPDAMMLIQSLKMVATNKPILKVSESQIPLLPSFWSQTPVNVCNCIFCSFTALRKKISPDSPTLQFFFLQTIQQWTLEYLIPATHFAVTEARDMRNSWWWRHSHNSFSILAQYLRNINTLFLYLWLHQLLSMHIFHSSWLACNLNALWGLWLCRQHTNTIHPPIHPSTNNTRSKCTTVYKPWGEMFKIYLKTNSRRNKWLSFGFTKMEPSGTPRCKRW